MTDPGAPLELLKLVVALLLGVGIGIERELHGKPAGLKTIALVTLAGAMLAMLSIHLGLLAHELGAEIDASRIIAGVVTGIGFLGAGSIIRSGQHVEGVTTAAMIWLMSAVGLAIGSGAWTLALAAYVLAWLVLLLDPLYDWLMPKLGIKHPRAQTPTEPNDPFN